MNFAAISFPFSLTSAVAKVFDLLGSIIQKALAKSYTWEIKGLFQAIYVTSKVELHASFFISEYKIVALIAAVLALPFVLVAVCQALLSQGPAQLLRLVGIRLPAVAIITLAAVPISFQKLAQILLSFISFHTLSMLLIQSRTETANPLDDRLLHASHSPPLSVQLHRNQATARWIGASTLEHSDG